MPVITLEGRIQQEYGKRLAELKPLVFAQDIKGTLDYLDRTIDDEKLGVCFGVRAPALLLSILFFRSSDKRLDQDNSQFSYLWLGSVLMGVPKFQIIVATHFTECEMGYDDNMQPLLDTHPIQEPRRS